MICAIHLIRLLDLNRYKFNRPAAGLQAFLWFHAGAREVAFLKHEKKNVVFLFEISDIKSEMSKGQIGETFSEMIQLNATRRNGVKNNKTGERHKIEFLRFPFPAKKFMRRFDGKSSGKA